MRKFRYVKKKNRTIADSRNLAVGEVFQESYECDAITWEIPHVSSLDLREKSEIRSPKFSSKNATWILKICPCLGHDSDGKAQILVTIKMERLHSEIPDHSFYCTSFVKYRNAVKSSCKHEFVKFDAYRDKNVICLPGLLRMNWNSLYKDYRWNDTITLTVEILIKKDFETKSTEVDIDPLLDKDADSFKSIGELLIESFDVSLIAWKIPKMHSIPLEADKNVQSPAFSVAGVPWILKLFPCGQTRFNSKGIDVVIEKLHFHIVNQTVLYNIVFESYRENESLIKDYRSVYTDAWERGSFNFDSRQLQENVLVVLTYDNCLRCAASSPEIGTVVLKCAFRISKETETGLNFVIKSLESFKESSEVSSEQTAVSVASTSNDSMPLKTASIGNTEFGEIIKTKLECDIICWTMSSFSLLDEKSKSVKSPQFAYKGAIWILEIYPHGHSYPVTKGNMQIVMKRLHSQFAVHNLFCRICLENRNGEKCVKVSDSFTFDSSHEERILYQGSLYFSNIFAFYKHWRYHDSLKLVCELYNHKNFVTEVDNKTKSLKADLKYLLI